MAPSAQGRIGVSLPTLKPYERYPGFVALAEDAGAFAIAGTPDEAGERPPAGTAYRPASSCTHRMRHRSIKRHARTRIGRWCRRSRGSGRDPVFGNDRSSSVMWR